MVAFGIWVAVAALVCGIAQHTGDLRPVVAMFVASLLMPDDIFLTED